MLSGNPRTPEELALQAKAIELVQNVSNTVHEVADYLLSFTSPTTADPAKLNQISPFCLDSLYCAIVTIHWLRRENGDREYKSSLSVLENCLTMLGSRWKLGKAYLALADRYEAFHTLLNE
jgi:hypothetical protein